jgi:hypothetical protein
MVGDHNLGWKTVVNLTRDCILTGKSLSIRLCSGMNSDMVRIVGRVKAIQTQSQFRELLRHGYGQCEPPESRPLHALV